MQMQEASFYHKAISKKKKLAKREKYWKQVKLTNFAEVARSEWTYSASEGPDLTPTALVNQKECKDNTNSRIHVTKNVFLFTRKRISENLITLSNSWRTNNSSKNASIFSVFQKSLGQR